MTSPFGTSWLVAADIDPSFGSITSQAPGDLAARSILTNALVRALDMPPGTLPDAPERGYDLKRLLLLELDQATIDAEAQLIADECERDERVISATAEVTQERTGTGIRAIITILVVPDWDGPFEFTITASQAAVKVQIQDPTV